MSGAGSLVDLDQQIISNTKYERETDPNGGGDKQRKLNERFGEHRRSILNHHQLLNPTPVSLHFNQPGHSINDVQLIPLELIRSKRDSVRKAREAHLINKAKTLHPLGINRRDETRQ